MRSLFVLWAFWCCLSGCTKKTTDLPPHFQKIPAGKSGLSFNNSLQHDLQTSFNLFDYDYFYNGAGVGVEDLNNDGLKDIFFCGNQVPNKLFLNKGGLVFEDVSDHAGINTGKYWANGVSFADVNQDGWMDIYVSQGGPHTRAQRGNLLYINQQNMTFKEQAHEVGLDDQGISTQSAFFDYDKDGDLDCVVMNENAYYGVDPARFYQLLSDKEKLEKNSSHLYRNEAGVFVSVTEAAGLLKPSFGLGLCVGDINNDSWPDIYIANDYYVPDALYINNQDGSFTDRIKESTQQVSFYGMGLDIADINNDNLEDIFVLDMASTDHVRSKTLMASMNVPRFHFLTQTLGLQHQYMYNSLQLNLGNNQFHNIAQLTGMSKTDWSWAGLIFDTDHDSQEDVYVTNGYRRYALDNDAKTNIVKAKQQYKGKVPLAVKERIYNELPSEKLSNILYKNLGELHFKDQTETANLQDPSFSNGAAYADLDNDGDLDIVVNNIDAEAFLYRNNAVENKLGNFLKIIPKGQQSESFAKVRISFDGLNKTKESKRVRGYLSSVDNSLHFGLGNATSVDSLEIRWPSGKVEKRYNIQANTTLVLQETEALKGIEEPTETSYRFEASTEHLHHKHVENDFNDFKKEGLLPYKQSTLGPSMAKGDVNKDGRTDLYIGGASGTGGALYLQTDKGFNKVAQAAFEADAAHEDMEALFVDLDNDKDLDLYVVSGGSEFNERSPRLKDRIYRNDGQGHFSKIGDSPIDDYTISGKTVCKIDFDKDGDDDLIVGNRIRPQQYPVHEPSIIYENRDGILYNVTQDVAADFEDFGIVNKVITTDFNNDGWDDFIAVGEWTSIGLFKNNQGVFENIASQSKLDTEKGWWFSITETDLNKDGKKDYLVGNIGKNIKFKVTDRKPLRVYADDFDDNGTHDVVLSYQYKGIFVPARGKECSTQQMPFIAEKMPSFDAFAHASLEDIYGEKIHTAYQREANQFASIALLNEGAGIFKKVPLPHLVQTMPVLDAAPLDVNKDGFEDLVVVGNIHHTEVETPRLDNPYALVLLSNGQDGYRVEMPSKTGLYIQGNAKSVEVVQQKDQAVLVIGCNDGAVEVFLHKP